MKTISTLTQNTPEWHKWREQGIGASESNIIMGVSKFMSPRQLMDQKINGKKDTDKSNFITDKGHRLEAKARPLFELEMDSDFPDMIAIHDELEFVRASLDGFSKELNACWECKFVGQADFEIVKNGGFLPQYYPQIQHQIFTTGADVNYLYVITDDKEKKEAGSSFPYKTAFIGIKPDVAYINDLLMPAVFEFWKMYEDKVMPELSELDVVNLSGNVDLGKLIHDYEQVKYSLDSMTKLEKELKVKIFKIAKFKKCSFGDITFTNSLSADKTVFDYKKFELENPIEKEYLKIQKGRKTQRINFPKVEKC